MEALLFALLTAVALAELGLTAYLVNGYEANGYPSSRYRSLIIFILFDASWTALFGLAYVCFIAAGALSRLAGIAASVTWLLITAILWGVAAGLYSNPNQGGRTGGMCWDAPTIDPCRQTQTVAGLAWTAFTLCIVTMIVSCCTWRATRAPSRSVSRLMTPYQSADAF
jgi:hypothetical protein